MPITYTVCCAVYGTIKTAVIVTPTLQALLNASPNGVIAINNTTMGGNPSPGEENIFIAVVTVNGMPQAFICVEGQSINFA